MVADATEDQSVSYTCTATCDLNWERRLGYFKTTTKVRTFEFGIEGKRCPVPGHFFLYLSELKGSDRVWRCSVENCDHKETT